MDPGLPQTMGYEAAAQAGLAVLSFYAPIPPSLDFAGAAALPAAIETATRALDQLAPGRADLPARRDRAGAPRRR
jgi:NADPH:quinone reductase-like Zn-dependent oxidoreductase